MKGLFFLYPFILPILLSAYPTLLYLSEPLP